MTDNTKLWEDGTLGRDENYVEVAPQIDSDLVDKSLNLKLISIRLPIDLINDLKELAKQNGLGYQPYIRQILTNIVSMLDYPELTPEQLQSIKDNSSATSIPSENFTESLFGDTSTKDVVSAIRDFRLSHEQELDKFAGITKSKNLDMDMFERMYKESNEFSQNIGIFGMIGSSVWKSQMVNFVKSKNNADCLVKCRDKFQYYVDHHLAKGDTVKANQNQEMVDMINSVLNNGETNENTNFA